MSDWLRTLWSGLLFRNAAFTGLSERRDAFLQGFLMVVAVGLVIGLPTLVIDFVGGLQPNAIEVQMDQAMTELDQTLQQMQPFLRNLPSGVVDSVTAQIKENMQFALQIAREVEALPTFLPKPMDKLFKLVGQWASRPFSEGGFPLAAAAIGTWLGYGIWVMLFAKLLGGKGTLTGFFGTTALYAVPHLLSFFAFIPILGSILGFIAYFWGVAIYVKSTAASHQLSLERALLAVLLPLLIILLLVIISATGLATLIAISVAGGGH